MSQVLYFPHLSLPETGWVNPAILFFERIGVITPDVPNPSAAELDKLFDQRTLVLVKEKIVQPVFPGDYYLWGAQTDQRFLEVLLRRAREPHSAAELIPGRLHVGKFASTNLLQSLMEKKLIQRTNFQNWVMAPNWLGDHLMTYLAVQLSSSRDLGMDLVTDDGVAWTRMTGQGTREAEADRRLRAVTSLLPVAPDVEVSDLLTFRAKRQRELDAFRSYVENLLRDASSESGQETDQFAQRLREAEQCRAELIHALEEMRWDKVAVRIGLSMLPMVSSVLDSSPWSAVAGMVPFALQLCNERQAHQSLEKALQSPLAFAALAHRLSRAKS